MKKFLTPLFSLACLLLASCNEPVTQPLRLGTNLWPGYEPLYMAREKGYLDNNKIHLIEYTSASQVLSAFQNGLVDAAAVTLDEAIKLIDMGEQLKILLVTDISNGADALLGQPQINSISQINGKRVGFEHTALGAYFISRIIELNKINKNDITLVPLEVNQHERAFKNKEIDAVITFEPVRSKLLAIGAHVLFDSSQIPDEIVDVIVIRENKQAVFNNQISHLKSAWFRTLIYIKNKPRESASILSLRLKLDLEQTIHIYKTLQLADQQYNQILLSGKPEPALQNTARNMIRIMLEQSLIKSAFDPQQLFIQNSD